MTSQGLETLVFRTGGRAEAAARSLAERFAGLGRAKRLRIILPDGSLAGAYLCEPGLAGPRWRRMD